MPDAIRENEGARPAKKDLSAGKPLPPARPRPEPRMTWHSLNRIWQGGSCLPPVGPVHVSMNDYLIHRRRDIPRVIWEGLRLRRRWPQTGGTLGLWMAAFRAGRRQVSVSIWESPEDLRRFVRSPEHKSIMRKFRNAGALHTNAWTAEQFDPTLIWRQAADRLAGRVAGVSHH